MPRKKYISDEEKQLNTVLDAYQYSKSYYSNRFNKFRVWGRLFHQLPDKKSPFRSNLFIPLVYPIVSTILPRMVANLPKFRYEPREESDQKDVEQMSTLVDYQLDVMDFFKKLKMWVKDVLIYGTGVIKLYWHREDGKEYNDPDMDVCDVFELYPDPKASEIDGGDFMIHRTITSLNFLKNQKTATGEELYQNLDKIRSDGNTEDNNKMLMTNRRDMTQGELDAETNMGSPFRQSPSKQIELLEYWGVWGENGDEYVITVANRSVVVRAELNPYNGKRPFIKMHVDPNNHEFYGKGLIEPIEDLQFELNDIRNQRMDNVNLILNKLFVVLKNANVNENELISRPGGVIYEEIPGGVRELPVGDVTQSAYQEEALVKQDAQNAVGVTDIIQGQLRSADETVPGQSLNKTATGAAIAVQQAGSRFKYYLQNIEDALRDFGLRIYEYNQTFLDEEKLIRVQAPNDYKRVEKVGLINKLKGMIGLPDQSPVNKYEFRRVSPETLKNLKLDVKVEAGSTQPIEDSLRQQKVMNLMQMMSQIPVVTPDTYMVLVEKLLDAYEVPDKERILQTLKVPEGQTQPKVSVSLRGDLNPFQTADIAKQAGATDLSTDPKLIAELKTREENQSIREKLVDHSMGSMLKSELEEERKQNETGQSTTEE